LIFTELKVTIVCPILNKLLHVTAQEYLRNSCSLCALGKNLSGNQT
ncbi:hypothetical protein EG68_06704, partial [Paragonimus skrjabini miyazakii]